MAAIVAVVGLTGCDDGEGGGSADAQAGADLAGLDGGAADQAVPMDGAAPDGGVGAPRVIAITAGEQHSVLLAEGGRVFMAGNGNDGQLCMGEAAPFAEAFTELAGAAAVVGVEAGSATTFLIKADGSATACGYAENGRLGLADGAVVRQYEPAPVAVADPIQAIRAGGGHTLVLNGDDALIGFGASQSGEVGVGVSGADVETPTGLATLDGETVIGFDAATGGGYSVAVTEGGTVYTWGNNLQGQLGDNGAGPSAVNPGVLGTVDGVAALAAGGGHTLALKTDGTVWGWGFNGQGELGRGAPSMVETPAAVPGLSGVVAIATGTTFSLALDGDGAVWCWGASGGGQCGLGPQVAASTPTPTRVPGLPPIQAIAAGSAHALALTTDGRVWGWGLVDAAQLGTGISDFQYDPIEVF